MFPQSLRKFGWDPYVLALLGTVALASLFPVSGAGAAVVSVIAFYAVALLFLIYGAKLDTSAVVAGMANWRLQLQVLGLTYLVFPLGGLLLSLLLAPWLDPDIIVGLLFLSVLPSTIQSSIAFTSMARGNVSAALCAASLSNLLAVFLTPLLAALLLQRAGMGLSLDSVGNIALQILLPFALGQALRPLIGRWLERQKLLTMLVDRGSILLIVYSAFSAGVVAGIWQQVSLDVLAVMVVADIALLAAIMTISWFGARATGLPRADRMVMLFCGSTKSMGSGIPIANILFAGQAISLIVLPLMIFHQIQLLVCAVIAQRYAAETTD